MQTERESFLSAVVEKQVSGQPAVRPQVTEVADTFVALVRSFERAKARLMAATEHDVEWAAQVLLRHLHREGPMRAGELADSVQSDPSTVSRQVAALVRDGLVERRADPEDGRASILVLTDKADAVIAAHGDLRNQHFADMLADWSARDLDTFAGLLRRFTTDFDNASHSAATSDRPGLRAVRPAEGK